MHEFHSPYSETLPYIPDDLTVVQFILDYHHPKRPLRKHGIPWLIDDKTGKTAGLEELRLRTYGLANALSSKYNIAVPTGEDDIVLAFSKNHIDFPVAMWATHRLGAIFSPANPDFTADELHYQLVATNATLILVHPDSIDAALSAARAAGIEPSRIVLFNHLSPEMQPPYGTTINDLVLEGLSKSPLFVERKLKPGEGKTKLAFLSFSSGTTGKPKAVAIPHTALIANVIQIAAHNRVNEEYTTWEERRYRPGDVAIGVLPLYHIYGLVINLHFVLFSAMSFVVVPKFNFLEFLKSIVHHRITHLMIVPPQAVLLCKHPAVKNYDLNTIRCIMVGAAPLTEEINRQLFQTFPSAHIGQAYGMTETCTSVTMWPVTQKRGSSGSGGVLLPGVVARVMRPDGSSAGPGEVGELWIKSPSLALGYANDATATKETFVDGWVVTGDEVKIDHNSELWVVDRLKEIMKVKGFQVAPAELEGCILDHPDVADVGVVGIPDDYSGEVPLAFVVPTVDATKRVAKNPRIADEIKTSIMEHVAHNKVNYKRLAGGVVFVDAIPKNPSGKLLRRLLREQAKKLKQTKAKL